MHPPARALREKTQKGFPVLGTFLLEFSGPAVVGVMAMEEAANLRAMGVQMIGFQCDIGMFCTIATSIVNEFTKAVR